MYQGLEQLLQQLEYGTKLHIGVQFFGNMGSNLLDLPSERRIHVGAICDEAKLQPNGLRRCVRCRNLAFHKAVKTKQPFGGLCVNGLYEYLYPMVVEGEVVAVIFIGNVGSDPRAEQACSPDRCAAMAAVIESYIRLLPADPAPRDPLLENLKGYIDANLDGETSLPRLAGLFHYNEKYLGRLFKKKTGLTVHGYVNQQQLERAAELLRTTSYGVAEIALQVGYENVPYFNRIFLRRYGCTPTDYRRG